MIEDFLIKKGFELHTYNGANKRYYKEITEIDTIYVRIYSDANEIVEVEYENIPVDKFDSHNIVSFETINSLKQLKKLIKALKKSK